MSTTLSHAGSERALAPLLGGFERLAAETMALLEAMLNPGRIISEVERMRALQTQAARVEATDPALAAQLRERAARILR